jgi:hypothetical protein
VKIVHFADYDRDGQRTEFSLHNDTEPFGKSFGIVVGVATTNPKLHIFATARNPSKALVLQKHIWADLSHAERTTEIIDWPCDDHGSDVETTVEIKHTSEGIDGVRRTYACPRYPDQRPQAEEPL